MRLTRKNLLISSYLFFILVGVFITSLIPRRFTQLGNINVIILYIHFLAVFSIFVLFNSRIVIRVMYERILLILLLILVFLIELWICSIMLLPKVTILSLLLKLEVLLIFYATVKLTSSESGWCLRAILIIIAGSMTLAVIYSHFGVQIAAVFGRSLRILNGGTHIRATSPIGGPNLVGLVCVISMPYTLHYSRQKTSWLIAFIMFLATIILTSSKTSFLAGILGIITYYSLAKNLGHLKVRRTIPVIFFLLSIFYAMKQTRVRTVLSSLDAGGSNRLEVWRNTIALAGSRLLGWGTDYWINVDVPFSAHSLWLQLVLDYGWARGLIIWGVFLVLFCHFFKIAYIYRRQIGAALGGSLIALFVASHGDYHFWEPRVLLLIAIIMGIGISATREGQHETISSNR